MFGGHDRDDIVSGEVHPHHSFEHEPVHMSLDEMLASEPGRFFTTLHVVSLAGFRAAVGDQWAKLAEKVLLIAEGVIHRHMGTDGVFGQRGDDMFVLVFSRLTEQEAGERTETIAAELGERLLGSTRFSVGGLVHAAHLRAVDALESGALNLDLLAGAVRQARAAAAQGTPLPLRRHLMPSAKPSAAEERRRFREFRDAITLPDDAVVASIATEARLRLDFLPTWVASHESLDAAYCRVRRPDSIGGEWVGEQAYSRPDIGFAIDRHVAGHIERLLPGTRAVVIVPIAFTSLVTRQRLLLTEIYAGIPEALRMLRLDFEMFGVPDNASHDQLLDAAAALKDLGRQLLLRVLPGRENATGLAADAGFDGIGVDAAELPPESFETVCRHATDMGLTVSAWNLPTRLALAAAVAAGCDRVNGKALAPPGKQPGPALHVARELLLKG